jgi:hypothetical protein
MNQRLTDGQARQQANRDHKTGRYRTGNRCDVCGKPVPFYDYYGSADLPCVCRRKACLRALHESELAAGRTDETFAEWWGRMKPPTDEDLLKA